LTAENILPARAPDAFTAWLAALTVGLDLLRDGALQVARPPLGNDCAAEAQGLLRLCQRVGLDPGSAAPAEGVADTFAGVLRRYPRQRLAGLLVDVLLPAVDSAMSSCPHGAVDLGGQIVFRPASLPVALLCPPGSLTPDRAVVHYRQLPAGHPLALAVAETDCLLVGDRDLVVVLGPVRQESLFRPAEGVFVPDWRPARWLRVGDVIRRTREAEAERRKPEIEGQAKLAEAKQAYAAWQAEQSRQLSPAEVARLRGLLAADKRA
jgi:hypothetical protein